MRFLLFPARKLYGRTTELFRKLPEVHSLAHAYIFALMLLLHSFLIRSWLVSLIRLCMGSRLHLFPLLVSDRMNDLNTGQFFDSTLRSFDRIFVLGLKKSVDLYFAF